VRPAENQWKSWPGTSRLTGTGRTAFRAFHSDDSLAHPIPPPPFASAYSEFDAHLLLKSRDSEQKQKQKQKQDSSTASWPSPPQPPTFSPHALSFPPPPQIGSPAQSSSRSKHVPPSHSPSLSLTPIRRVISISSPLLPHSPIQIKLLCQYILPQPALQSGYGKQAFSRVLATSTKKLVLRRGTGSATIEALASIVSCTTRAGVGAKG